MAHEPSFSDTQNFADASQGFLGALTPGIIRTPAGKTAWDIDSYAFLDQQCPPTANPKLWRQCQWNSKQGLYEITQGIYQIRALDISNMTIIEGKDGIMVIDPLISHECAATALDLYRKYRDPEKRREVKAVIYSHSHADHYMGCGGILPPSHASDPIPIIAPEGFIRAVLSEMMIAGPAMRQRAVFMYGNALPRGPEGQIGVGLGMGTSTGSRSTIPANLLVTKTAEELVVDGTKIVFQMIPDTEAPAEFNFFFPDFKTLYVAETATNCMHNIVTLRGAQVRDAKAWSSGLDETMVLFAKDADILIGGHNWPTWGQKEIIKRITEQRDMYGYMHDQTVRLMNLGLTGIEIAEQLKLPPRIASVWHCQGFYGSLSHNVKGIYQKYMSWFDGNPANLWKLPPAEEGKRYVDCFGGIDALCTKAAEYIEKKDLRFAVTLLHHAVAAFPEVSKPRRILADVYECLGFGAENATWRNFYLTGAMELRNGEKVGRKLLGRMDLGQNMTIDQWFTVMSVQINGVDAAEKNFVIDFDIMDKNEVWRIIISNGVLVHRRKEGEGSDFIEGKADLRIKVQTKQLLELLHGRSESYEEIKGDPEVLKDFLRLINVPLQAKGSTSGRSQL